MHLRLHLATAEQAPDISALRLAAAARLTAQFGPGPWSRSSTVNGVLYDLRHSVLYVATRRNQIIATLALCTKKPWAIAPRYFTRCRTPLYLVSLAVAPAVQHTGVGRACLTAVEKIAAAWPADFIRLDAYDAAAGAGDFYRRCGFTEVGRATYRGVPLIYFERKPERTEPADLAG
jgi:ribosomal protein S18 acetylase RimI-like enzyme